MGGGNENELKKQILRYIGNTQYYFEYVLVLGKHSNNIKGLQIYK